MKIILILKKRAIILINKIYTNYSLKKVDKKKLIIKYLYIYFRYKFLTIMAKLNVTMKGKIKQGTCYDDGAFY
jgi:hypothetical protein